MTDLGAAMPGSDDSDTLVHGLKVYDESRDCFGIITDAATSCRYVYVRPLGGGVEWTALREHLRPARLSDLLADQLRQGREGGTTA